MDKFRPWHGIANIWARKALLPSFAIFTGITAGNSLPLITASIVGLTIGFLSLISPWLALAVLLAVIVCLLALGKPILLCYLTIVAIALTSGMQRGKLIPYLILNEPVLLFSAGLAFIIILAGKRHQVVHLHSVKFAILVLVVGTMLIPGASYLIRGTALTVKDVLVLLAPIQYVLLFWLFTYLPGSNLERQRILKLMLLCGIVVAVVGLLQGAKVGFITDLLHDWYGSGHEAKAVSYGRITSLMSAWNGLGIFLMVNIFIAWSFGISRPGDLGHGLVITVCVVCTAGLIVSGSYAGMIGLLSGILVITFFMRGINRKTITLLAGLVIAFVVAVALFKPLILKRLDSQFGYGGTIPATLVDRFRIWQDIYLPAIQQNLVWGVNPTIPMTYSWRHTESQYLTLLFSVGLVGLIAFMAWVGITLSWLMHRFRQHAGLLKPVSVVAIAILLVLSGAGFTNAVFTYSGTADYLWILLALAAHQPEVRP